MKNMIGSLYNIKLLDELSEKKSTIHNIHPLAKLITTIVFILITVSYDKYDISRLMPLFSYPILVIIIAEIPIKPILKRVFITLPFVIGVGIFNPIFDSRYMIVLKWIQISGGWISFISILIKCILTVSSVFILIATTGINGIALALRIMKVPKIFVMQITLTYRYITLLIEEVYTIVSAYSIRSLYETGINFKVWGPLMGNLLIRTIDKSQRIYQAMCCRGFLGEYNIGKENIIKTKDAVYICLWINYFILVRYLNITNIVGLMITGGLI
ncbi:cobalt ECF transporter T component CbiQ [Tepidibacter aestuarii]|uniref:cobalt ECF transporter T component CbiQ n=1 Tax=Tepidibacter aestuarii TaxID=2925782 RepID=UPI0020BDB3D0|nr:cobalt ECF transporter T component CbiQ [Tepidibacter aestuarii]CAH2212911.1 Cobalt/nickel transport system permease protein [Tepidibacter aestuarii]